MKIRYAIMLAALVVPLSCVHEYPENGGVDPTEIALTFNFTTDPSITEGSVLSGGLEAGASVHFIFEIYKNDYTGDPIVRHEADAVRLGDGSASVQIKDTLHAGNYKGVVFAVCTKDMDKATSVYEFDDLAHIEFKDPYPGPTPLKECYDDRFDITLSADDWFSSEEFTRILHSPMGRVEIVSTDAADFKEDVMSGTSVPEGNTSLASFSWDNYYVRWDYSLYFPNGYNALTGLPNKAETSVYFTSPVTVVSDEEVLLGYEYVFVNGEETSVDLALSLYESGTDDLLNTYAGVKASLVKGKTTVIKDSFLTEGRDSGIGIDPGFDGSIDIVLPD